MCLSSLTLPTHPPTNWISDKSSIMIFLTLGAYGATNTILIFLVFFYLPRVPVISGDLCSRKHKTSGNKGLNFPETYISRGKCIQF